MQRKEEFTPIRPRDCQNCHYRVHTPDSRTGLIHIDGYYQCRKFRTVAA